jgi:outer membrane protein OmpA-like peptidoglycan-associated protein
VLRRDFDEFTDYRLRTGKSKATGAQTLEGRVTRLTYEGPADRAVLEVFRNYEQQLRADGFTILFSCAREQCGDIRKEIESGPRYMLLWGGGDHRYLAARRAGPQGEVHVAVWVTRNSGGGPARGRAMVQADIVESGAMETRMTLVDADALGRDIAQDGLAVVHGIHFDVDRDTLRPDAAPQIAEIGRLLVREPSMRVRVVGHTDAQGSAAHNADLSRRRAQRIVDVLVREHGIARSRLAPEGRGASEPVADNATEAGRAQNRRVEIIRR